MSLRHNRQVHLDFLDRTPERARLDRVFERPDAAFVCVYGRRRCGKSRLLQEVLRGHRAAYYVGDDRDAALERADLARALAHLLPGFDAVEYPDWGVLLERWWREAQHGSVLVLDEFPAMVRTAPALPSVLQRLVDTKRGPHLVVCGSSQRMMHGLVLDGSAPLYGRASEILRLEPLPARFLVGAVAHVSSAVDAIESYAVWGGVPRYWELAADYPNRRAAIRDLLLDPHGVLHREPERLLLDDMRDTARAASILALIGAGCHRPSEIAGRLGQPATSLSRPLARLVDLGLVAREVPFGTAPRKAGRTYYRIGDPLLTFWFTFVEPNRSRLAAGHAELVAAEVAEAWPRYLGPAWEGMVRSAVPRLEVGGRRWGVAQRWWGKTASGGRAEIDIVAECVDAPRKILVGEVKRSIDPRRIGAVRDALLAKAADCPALAGREVVPQLWSLERAHGADGAEEVLPVL